MRSDPQSAHLPAPTDGLPPAVVVVCHGAYLDRLPACLASIEAQHSRSMRILVLDGCDFPQRFGWKFIKMAAAGEPNPLRNAGWQWAGEKGAQWCVFWDADNLMPAAYLDTVKAGIAAAPASTAILSPSIIRGKDGQIRFTVCQPATRDAWQGRQQSLSDSSSAWRIEALHQCGGFRPSNTMLDDYILAMSVTRLGWKTAALPAIVWLADHDENRSLSPTRGEPDLWKNSHLHIITLLAGRAHCLDQWLDSAMQLDLPAHVHWTIVDDSTSAIFKRRIKDAADMLSHRREVQSVRIIKSPFAPQPNMDRLAIHRRVAALYNIATSGQNSDMTLFWEDDVIPPADALMHLHEGFTPFSRQGAVSAVYPSRENKDVAVASLAADRWGTMPTLDWLKSRPYDRVNVGMVGGGFTLYAGHHLARALPLQTIADPCLGWDGYLSRALTNAGATVQLDTRAPCLHLTL